MTESRAKYELSGSGGHLNEEGVALYTDALFLHKEARLPRDMRSHVAACSRCRKEVYDLYTLVNSSKALQPDYRHPFLDGEGTGREQDTGEDSFLKRISGRASGFWRIAAIVLAFVAIGSIITLLGRQKSEDNRLRSEIVERLAPEPHPVSADNVPETLAIADYRPKLLAEQTGGDPRMESVLKMNLRAGDFSLLQPVKNVEVKQGDRLTVSWKSDRRNSVTLMILDGDGVNRSQAELKIRKSSFIVNLPPARYYYVLISGQELLAAGTITVAAQ